MENLNKYFLKYNNICKKIFIKEIELENLKELNKTVGTRNFSGELSKNNNKTGLESKLIKVEALSEQLKILYEKKERRKKKHISDFQKLSKNEYEIILTLYYLEKVSIKNISIKLDRSIGHIKKMKREAVNELIEVIKKA